MFCGECGRPVAARSTLAAPADNAANSQDAGAQVQDPHDLIISPVDPDADAILSPAVEELVIPAPSSHTIPDTFMMDVGNYDDLAAFEESLPSPETLSNPFSALAEQHETPAAAPPPAQAADPEPEESLQGSWCAQCGALLSDSDIFCGECGFVRTPSSRPRDTAILDPFPWGSDTPVAAMPPAVPESHTEAESRGEAEPDPEPFADPVVEPDELPERIAEPDLPQEALPAEPSAPPSTPEVFPEAVREAAPPPPVAPLPPMPGSGPVPAFPGTPRRRAPEPLGASDGLEEDVEQTRIVAPGAGGDRFILQFSTGESVSVTGSGLLGRNPLAEPGEYFDALVTISDPGKSVSKTHLEFGQDGGAFWVSDRHSGNGTVVREPERPARRCDPGKRYRIARGTRVEIGEQFFIVS
ncbi:hypothetical protein HDC94_001530 [Leifsonia sp. AK011]|nr:hypothetical protein [Leifsonia sp. AK011]